MSTATSNLMFFDLPLDKICQTIQNNIEEFIASETK